VVYVNGRTYEQSLTFEDFAPNDPSIDLLHVLNNADNTSKELKELLTTINDQKNKLKQANKEIQDIALSLPKIQILYELIRKEIY
jgi:chromosome segregation ATPase